MGLIEVGKEISFTRSCSENASIPTHRTTNKLNLKLIKILLAYPVLPQLSLFTIIYNEKERADENFLTIKNEGDKDNTV